jgi:hypothetical protein
MLFARGGLSPALCVSLFIMKEFLANLGLWVGAIIGVLTIIDWLLIEKQKKKITSWCESLWLWLEYQRVGRFLKFLMLYKVQVISSIIILLSFLYFGHRALTFSIVHSDPSIISGLFEAFLSLLMLIVVFGLSWKIHPKIISWTLKTNSIVKFYLRCLLIILLFIFLLSPFYGFPSEPLIFELLPESEPLMMICYFLIIICFCLIVGELLLVTTNFLLSVSWLVLVLVLMSLFKVVQFFLIRIIEYPKGPVLGVSGLLIGVAALVKAFM